MDKKSIEKIKSMTEVLKKIKDPFVEANAKIRRIRKEERARRRKKRRES